MSVKTAADSRTDAGIGLVVADLAGTVVDFGCQAPTMAFRTLFEENGIELSDERIREPMGMHKRDHIQALCRMPEVARQWRERHGREVSEADIDTLFQQFVPGQLACLPSHCDLIPGTAEAASRLQAAGVRIGATTGYNREMLGVVIEHARRQGYCPDVAFSSVDVRAGRPAPWMIFRCMEAAGVYPPRRVVKIGDTVSDIEAGRNAGVWSVGITATGSMLGLTAEQLAALPGAERERRLAAASDALRAAGAHAVVSSFAELPSLIERFEAPGERP